MATFDFEGKKVYYERHGDKGRPLVVLNGLMMSTTSWKPFVEDFSRNNQLVLVDFLDQGRSSRMSESYYHDVQIRLVDALLDELGWEKAVVMGLSYGGMYAIHLAAVDVRIKACYSCSKRSAFAAGRVDTFFVGEFWFFPFALFVLACYVEVGEVLSRDGIFFFG